MSSASESKDDSVLGSSVGIMGAQWAGLLLRFTSTLIAARLVDPDEIGYVAWMGIWPVYATWLACGVLSGAGRLIPVRVDLTAAEAG